MLCKKPFVGRGALFGCGQCRPCRINKKRQWMWRQWFEALLHAENCFVTLTYRDADLPPGGALVPSHLQLWLKRFRKAIYPRKVRFFAVGEYSHDASREWNPHYHLSLFGVSGLSDWVGSRQRLEGCAVEIAATWPYGNIDCKEFNERTAQYVAGYTVKKLTAGDDPRLDGRPPEFMRSSRRPGLGVDAMRLVAHQLVSGKHVVGDVPHALKLGRKSVPFGRFLLKKLRVASGMSPDEIQKAKDSISFERSIEMHSLFKEVGAYEGNQTVKYAEIPLVAQRILNAETRYKLWDEQRKERK